MFWKSCILTGTNTADIFVKNFKSGRCYLPRSKLPTFTVSRGQKKHLIPGSIRNTAEKYKSILESENWIHGSEEQSYFADRLLIAKLIDWLIANWFAWSIANCWIDWLLIA